jgi:hypothetical protein
VTSAVAVLTYRRLGALRACLDSFRAHLPPATPLAVFEDCATYDGTAAYLTGGRGAAAYDAELDSDVYNGAREIVYLGRRNEGVAGQSNKALRWFERTGCDHLCLCNDDVLALGDFPAAYAAAHQKLGVGFLTFSDLKDKPGYTYEGPVVTVKGLKVMILPRMVGLMLSLTKQVHQAVGYFDVNGWSRFGNEHCDFNNRARLMGFITLNGHPRLALDVVTGKLKSQDVASSVLDFERPSLDAQANQAIERAARRYEHEDLYRPFRLPYPRYSQYHGEPTIGLRVHELERLGYTFVVDRT